MTVNSDTWNKKFTRIHQALQSIRLPNYSLLRCTRSTLQLSTMLADQDQAETRTHLLHYEKVSRKRERKL